MKTPASPINPAVARLSHAQAQDNQSLFIATIRSLTWRDAADAAAFILCCAAITLAAVFLSALCN